MSNVWDEMRRAVDSSKSTLDAADNVAGDMARLLRGRLSHVSPYVLADLKKRTGQV
jgi:predicted aconitase with swiveling domain